MTLPAGHRSGLDLPLLSRPATQRVLMDISSLRAGAGLVVSVHGAPKTGKSALCRAIARQARGWSSYFIRIWESISFTEFVDLVLTTLGEQPAEPAEPADAPSDGHSCDSSGEPAGDTAGSPTDIKDKSRRLRNLLNRHNSEVLLVVDEAQFLQAGHIEVIDKLQRSLTAGRFVVLLCGLNNGAFIKHASRSIQTTPLTIKEIQTLSLTELGTALPIHLAESVQEITGGTIGLVKEVLDGLPADAWSRHPAALPIPDIWRARWDSKYKSLDPDILPVLQAVACLPEPATIDTLVAMVGNLVPRPEPSRAPAPGCALEHHLEAAVQAGVLSSAGGISPPQLAFQRVEDKAVVRSVIGPVTQRLLHQGAHDYFARRGEPDNALLHKALALTSHDEATSRELARAAAGLGRAGRWKEAARFYRMAAQLALTRSEAEALELDFIEAEVASSDIPAVSQRARTLDTRRPHMRRDSLLGYLAVQQGRRIEAEARFSNALLDPNPSDEDRAKHCSWRSLHALCQWQLPKVMELAEKSGELGGEKSEEALSAHYISLVAKTALTGTRQDTSAVAGESTVLAQRRNMANGWIALAMDDPLTARQELQQIPRDEGSTRISLWQIAWLARAQFLLGEWGDAVVSVQRGLSQIDRFDIDLVKPVLLWTGATIAQLRGEDELATSYRNQLVNGHDGFLIQRIPSAITQIVTSLRENRIAEAERATDELLAINRATPITQGAFWPWGDLAVNVLLKTKRFDEADELLSELEEAQKSHRLISIEAKLVAERGHQALSLGSHDKGVELYLRAVEMIESTQLPAYQARILFEFGQALRRLGRRKQADEFLSRAVTIYQAMGAYGLVEKINRERRAGGLGPRNANQSKLTVQELEVAQNAISGLTNREIAAQLYLSPKTVEFHLTRVYRKLGIRTRTELPAALSRAMRDK